MSEAIEEKPYKYNSVESLFIRKLKPQLRPIHPDTNSLVSPCDGKVTEIKFLDQSATVEAKSHLFSIDELLTTNEHNYQKAFCATIYLAPTDYHRMHMPCDGTITSMIYVPGKLYSVDPKICDYIPNILSKNERVIINVSTKDGELAIILVGAMIVGSIWVDWHGQVNPSHPSQSKTWDYASTKPIIMKKGQELGYFTFGSTVILVSNRKNLEIEPALHAGSRVKYGQLMAK